jgi:pimeloyl-ACP methyl ester carboxylesterase
VQTKERVEIRIHNLDKVQTLVYLPGLHGDWTLISMFRRALAGRVRFAELTYPATLSWNLNDYAENVQTALIQENIREGWVLAESFGSQIVWPLIASTQFKAHAVVLAGGFGKHPAQRALLFSDRATSGAVLALLTRVIFGCAHLLKWKFRNDPEMHAGVVEFIARRTQRDQASAVHRFRLAAGNDPCELVRNARIPVYGMSGLADFFVPWPWSRAWLRKHCPILKDYQVLPGADHAVLVSAPDTCARLLLRWMGAQ